MLVSQFLLSLAVPFDEHGNACCKPIRYIFQDCTGSVHPYNAVQHCSMVVIVALCRVAVFAFQRISILTEQ